MKQLGGAGAILAVVIALLAAACGGTSNAANEDSGGGKLTLVAYSTPQEAYEAIIPAFQKTAEGKGVEFEQSYGASGEQSRAVEAGLPADVVEFALDSDITRLVDAGLVDSDWNQNEYKGILTDSVVSFVVRKGNPDDIKTWDDLLKPGVEVVTPNPFTSGGARWNIMAAYGAQIKQGKSKEEASLPRRALPARGRPGRERPRRAPDFTGRQGRRSPSTRTRRSLRSRRARTSTTSIPEQTILIENPVAVTSDAPQSATDFVKFLYSDEAQKIFGEKGYRPVVKSVAEQSTTRPRRRSSPSRTSAAGATVKDEFFDPENGIVAKIEMSLGVSTDSG